MSGRLTVTRGSAGRTHGGTAAEKIVISFSGPFFEKDPSLTLALNITKMMAGMAQEGQDAARSLAPVRSGDFQRGIVGRVHSLGGKPWHLTAVISQTHVEPWGSTQTKGLLRKRVVGGKGSRGFAGRSEAQYRGGKVERKYHPFKSATAVLRRSRKLNVAELLKGIED